MRRSLLAIGMVTWAGCIDIPDNIHAQFAPPAAGDRSNYRLGPHGSAPPVEATASSGADAGAAPEPKAAPPPVVVDGGAP